LKSTALTAVLLLAFSSCVLLPAAHSSHAGVVTVYPERGAAAWGARRLSSWFNHTAPRLQHDFHVEPGRLTVLMFADHASFTRAAARTRSSTVQGEADNVGSVAAGKLLLGPEDSRYLHHNLVHVYSEWLLDHVVGNRSDRLPSQTWLYDGIGELEALRYAPEHLPCAYSGKSPFDVTRIDTAHRWMELRASPVGAEEYCLAALEVRKIVSRLGWSSLLQLLHREGIERAGRFLAKRFPPAA
jgi:hypothetical protein